MLIGAHLSIKKNLVFSLHQAKKLPINTLQIFSSSPRSWSNRQLDQQEISDFKKTAKQFAINPVFIHSKYLVNLSSDDPKTCHKSIESLIFDLQLAHLIKAQGVIIHPRQKNLKLLMTNLKKVLIQTPPATFLILENTSQTPLSFLGKLFQAINHPRLKFCLDTAHIFEQGYSIASFSGLKKMFLDLKKEIGFSNWLMIHANDSKTQLGSHHDQHQDIGQGKLGLLPFFVLVNHPITCHLPFILETPGFKEKSLTAAKKNIKQLLDLRFADSSHLWQQTPWSTLKQPNNI